MLHILFLSCAVAGVIWFLATPLRSGLWRFPGPWWRRYTGSQYHGPFDSFDSFTQRSNISLDIFQVLDTYNERTRLVVQRLHKDYGPVVQIGPRTLIFSDPTMIDQVYSNRSPLPKVCDYRPSCTHDPLLSRCRIFLEPSLSATATRAQRRRLSEYLGHRGYPRPCGH